MQQTECRKHESSAGSAIWPALQCYGEARPTCRSPRNRSEMEEEWGVMWSKLVIHASKKPGTCVIWGTGGVWVLRGECSLFRAYPHDFVAGARTAGDWLIALATAVCELGISNCGIGGEREECICGRKGWTAGVLGECRKRKSETGNTGGTEETGWQWLGCWFSL